MSSEQFRGDVTPVSDLYAIGACLLFLLTGSSPSEFPQKRLKVDISNVRASVKVKSVLERLLEPLPEDRMQSGIE
jgi:serine/threonine protein kinase